MKLHGKEDLEEAVRDDVTVTAHFQETVRAAAPAACNGYEYVPVGLHEIDIMKLLNLDFVYIFDKPTNAANLSKLKASLCQLLQHYPTLAGRIKGDQIELNNQGVTFCVQSSTNSIREMPEDPATGQPYCFIPVPGEQVKGNAPLLTVTVTQFVDGWTLGVVMNHLGADAWTFCMFMRDWSRMFNGDGIDPVVYQLPESVFQTCGSHKQADELANSLGWQRSQFSQQIVSKFLMKTLVPLVLKHDIRLGKRPNRLVLSYTDAQVKQIKAKAEANSKTWVSTNEAVMALVWQLMLDAAGLDSNHRAGLGSSYIVNLRNKIPGISERLAGNVVTTTSMIVDMTKQGNFTEGSSLEDLLHSSMRASLDPKRLQSAIQVHNFRWSNDNPWFISHESKEVGEISFAGVAGCLVWNWQAANPYYDVNFGTGKPLRGIPWNWTQQAVTVVPSASGGLEVHIDKGSRGPVRWVAKLQQAKSHWPRIRTLMAGIAILGAILLHVLLEVSPTIAILWCLVFGCLSFSAEALFHLEVKAAQQHFFDSIFANAHLSLNN
ncbi:Transferase family [Seminavis robusta]|uniref:Transferase family n=1 Tax=Seminavis robusta TaxID=568900 RepID=A0A9N8DYP3_9STRA|nr:Transferase family [Seminavis robusta]|eukprot:Sro481_g151540.1 Transferase family (547) ;mRNA; r:24302-25942